MDSTATMTSTLEKEQSGVIPFYFHEHAEGVMKLRESVYGKDHHHHDINLYRWISKNNSLNQTKEEPIGVIYIKNEEIIGLAIFKVNKILVKGKETTWGPGFDFMVHPDYQNSRVSIKIVKEWLKLCKSQKASFGCCFPNSRSLKVLTSRLCGFTKIISPRLMVRPVRSNWKSASLPFALKIPASIVTSSVAQMQQLFVKQEKDISVDRINSFIEDSNAYDQIWNDTKNQMPNVAVIRDTEYLQMRYFENPLYKYSPIVCSRNNKKEAFWVMNFREINGLSTGVIVDALGNLKNDALMNSLMSESIKMSEENGSQLMISWAIEGSDFHTMLKKRGFWEVPKRLDPKPFNFCINPTGYEEECIMDPKAWYFTPGDTDVI